MELFTDLISNVGFPIACVIGMFAMWNRELKSHREESAKFSTAIENNTAVINELKEYMKEIRRNVGC